MPPIRFEFRQAFEYMMPSGDYVVRFHGFMDVCIHSDMQFVLYRLRDPNKYEAQQPRWHRCNCEGILQAFAIVLDLLKHFDRLEFMPEHLTREED